MKTRSIFDPKAEAGRVSFVPSASASSQAPAWLSRLDLAAQAGAPHISFEDMSSAYQYLRSMRNLFDRLTLHAEGPTEWDSYIRKLHELFEPAKFGSLLDVSVFIHSVCKRRLGPERSFRDRLIEVGLEKPVREPDGLETRCRKYLEEGGKKNAAKVWKFRLECAIREAVEDGWYPVFGTYTVDEAKLPAGIYTRDMLWQDTPAWDRFLKKVKACIAESLGYGRRPSGWPRTADWFRYFAVLEHGRSGAHPHVHVVFLFKDMPSSWKVDPNANCANLTMDDIAPLSALWQWSDLQKKSMALFITGSKFMTELDWHVPKVLNKEKGELEERKVGDAGSVAGYVGKYLTKSIGAGKAWSHRVKATKGLGIQKLEKSIARVESLDLLLMLSKRPSKYEVWMKLQQMTNCPLSLIREKSKRELMRRWHGMRTRSALNSLREELTKERSEFYINLMNNVRDGLKPWRMTPESRYNTYTRIMEESNSMAHCKASYLQFKEWLCYTLGHDESSPPRVHMKGVNTQCLA